MKKINRIHFTSIKGVGVTPLAVIAKEAGFEVSGSDISDTYITSEVLDKVGIKEIKWFAKKNVEGVDLVITSGANRGFDNPEVKEAKALGIPVMTQGEAVGYFMSGEIFDRKDIKGISVTGCHGKTTTTALIATILKHAKKDPSFVIGTGMIPFLGSSGHYGKGNYFIAEADEYATEPKYDKTPKFLWHHPKIAVITNIEYDHPDLYPTFKSLVNAYESFMQQVIREKGILIACGDDKEIRKLLKKYRNNIITYGFNSNNDYVLKILKIKNKKEQFNVQFKNQDLGVFFLSINGKHNVLNALASIVVGLKVGLPITEIKNGLLEFKGTKRRMEIIGKTKNGAKIGRAHV